MRVTITPKPLTGSLSAISSKSLSHRYLIAAGLSQGTSIIENVLESDDLEATKDALSALGVRFSGNQVTGGPLVLNQKVIDCKESGSTLRFMIPILMVQSSEVTLTGKNRLPDRPIDVYQKLFQEKGYLFKQTTDRALPLTIQGPLVPGTYAISGDVSSQFVSGLLFALPLLKGDSVIELTTPLASKGYVDLTLQTLARFGIKINFDHSRFIIEGNQQYQPQNLSVEGDYSQAAFLMVAATIGQKIELSNLNPNSAQGDRAIVDLVTQMGGSIQYDEQKQIYLIKPIKTHGMTIDLNDIPDLGPILMVLAALSEGKTTFLNTARLKVKESDRLEAMIETLNRFGVKTQMIDNQALVVYGQHTLKGNQTFRSFKDHRIAMAIAIAAIRADGPIVIEDAEAVHKSYPTFFEHYRLLGGNIHES